MPAMKELRRNDRQAKFDHAHMLLFWKTEYTRRKFWLDYPTGSLQKMDLVRAVRFIHKWMDTTSYSELSYMEQRELMQLTIAAFHNCITPNPKYIYGGIDVQEVLPALPALLQNCGEQVALLRDVCFKYGYFVQDLWETTPGEVILEALAHNTLPDQPGLPARLFPRENDDGAMPCRFSYCDEHGHPFFEDEQEGYVYIYLDALGGGGAHYQEIETIPGKLKSSRNKKLASFGDRENATLQICIEKATPPSTWADVQAFCHSAIRKYRFTYLPNPCEGDGQDEWKKMWWTVYGLDHEQLSEQVRAVSLWLWDLVKKEGRTIEAAMKIIMASPLPHSRKYGKHGGDYRQFVHDLSHVCDCIERMEVLRLTS